MLDIKYNMHICGLLYMYLYNITSAMQGIKGASLSEKGLISLRSITGGSGIGCM